MSVPSGKAPASRGRRPTTRAASGSARSEASRVTSGPSLGRLWRPLRSNGVAVGARLARSPVGPLDSGTGVPSESRVPPALRTTPRGLRSVISTASLPLIRMTGTTVRRARCVRFAPRGTGANRPRPVTAKGKRIHPRLPSPGSMAKRKSKKAAKKKAYYSGRKERRAKK